MTAKARKLKGITFEGLPDTVWVSPRSSTQKARRARRRLFGHRATVRKSKGVYFPRDPFNVLMTRLRGVERVDPREYIYGYEFIMEELERLWKLEGESR